MKKIGMIVLLALVFSLALFLPVAAEEEVAPLSITLSQQERVLTDGKENVSATVKDSLNITCEEGMGSLYLIYYDTPVDFILSDGEKEVEIRGSYLRQFVDVRELFGKKKDELTLTFAEDTRLLELYAYGFQSPAGVQRWEEPCEKADLCLFTTHADDEQLFFAGVLPYYAGEKGLDVQVVYFTDHKNEPLRRHELLSGLWHVGITHYPVISPFPDLYSTSLAVAENQLNSRGFTHEDLVNFQVETIRRFKPKVLVGHDPEGEYGHGQHRLNVKTLQEALELSMDATYHAESAEAYGTWDVPKTYLHLYGEGQIEMNWDVPLEYFGGKTAFQMTQEGFGYHTSQHYTWFRPWLLGNNGQITAATEVATYSPCQYGLYRTTVGEDVEKNDFFENVLTWEQERIEEEKRKKEALTAYMTEIAAREEVLRAEGVSLYWEKQESASLRLQEEKDLRQRFFLLFAVALVVVLIAAVVLWLYFSARARKAFLMEQALEEGNDDDEIYPLF